jgi:hypothetical protein
MGFGVEQAQVEQNSRCDYGDCTWTYGQADSLLGQTGHHSGGGLQPEGAAAAQGYGMDLFHSMHRSEQVGFPGPWRAASHIHATNRPLAAQEYRAAGTVYRIGEMTSLQARYGGDGGVHSQSWPRADENQRAKVNQ